MIWCSCFYYINNILAEEWSPVFWIIAFLANLVWIIQFLFFLKFLLANNHPIEASLNSCRCRLDFRSYPGCIISQWKSEYFFHEQLDKIISIICEWFRFQCSELNGAEWRSYCMWCVAQFGTICTIEKTYKTSMEEC